MTDHDDDPQGFFAERDYLRERQKEIKAEFQETLKELGTELTPDTITPADIDTLREQYLSLLRESGNSALAERWLGADRSWQAAEQRLGVLNAEHRSGRRTCTVDEWLEARDAMNTALEEFERVNTEAGAWLAAHGPETTE